MGFVPICAQNELFKNALVGELLTDFVYPVLGKHVVLKTTVWASLYHMIQYQNYVKLAIFLWFWPENNSEVFSLLEPQSWTKKECATILF